MRLSPNEVWVLLLALGVLLAVARLLGEIAERFRQPAVLGEILAGVLLGPTVLGTLAPEWNAFLFPAQGSRALVLEGLTTLAITLFLLVAGMEVDLSTVWRQGKTTVVVSLAGIAVPFVLAFPLGWWLPDMLGREGAADRIIFALFFATAMSISALPVIAKTLMDLNLYRTDLGMVVIAAAIFNDLFGWILFAVILGLIGVSNGTHLSIQWTIWLVPAYAAVMLTLGRWLIHRILPWLQAHTSWPGGILAFALSLALLGGAFTEWIGVHAIFGAFLVGVAIGDSSHLRQQTRTIIVEFVQFIFAPLFFASIGLKVNFLQHFDLVLLLTVLVLACLGKVLGCGLGARWSGMPPREAWAVGFGMNARGAMEIILGLLALQFGVIGQRMFVALVLMALITSVMSGPMMQQILRTKRRPRLTDFLSARTFVKPLKARTRREAIRELSHCAAAVVDCAPSVLDAAVWAREQIMPTGLGNGVATPHARLGEARTAAVAIGLSETGVDFDAPDGEPAHVIFLLVTPKPDDGTQLSLLAEIARRFADPVFRESARRVANYTELLALLNTQALEE